MSSNSTGADSPRPIPLELGLYGGSGQRWQKFRIGVGDPLQWVYVQPRNSQVFALDVCGWGSISECPRPYITYQPYESNSFQDDENTYILHDLVAIGRDGQPDVLTIVNRTISVGPNVAEFGSFGIRPNDSSDALGAQSILSQLKNMDQIHGLSWSYAAGVANVRLDDQDSDLRDEILRNASFIFGGYDAQLGNESNKAEFELPEIFDERESDLVVNIHSIMALNTDDVSNNSSWLTRDVTTAIIDIENEFISLPKLACDRFQELYNLTWDPRREVYYSHSPLRGETSESPNSPAALSFTIGGNGADSLVTIEIPLGEMLLDRTFPPDPDNPNLIDSQSIIPVQPAPTNETVILGLPFLQAAYLIVDYDRRSFSLQSLLPESDERDIRAICPPNNENCSPGTVSNNGSQPNVNDQPDGGNQPRAVIVGGSVGGSVLVLIVLVSAFFIYRRRKHNSERRLFNVSRSKAGEELETNVSMGEMLAVDNPNELRGSGDSHETLANECPRELSSEEVGRELNVEERAGELHGGEAGYELDGSQQKPLELP